MSIINDAFNQASWLAQNGRTLFEWGTNSLTFSFLSPSAVPIPNYYYEDVSLAGGAGVLWSKIFFGLTLDNEDIIQFLPEQKEVIQFLFKPVDQIDSNNPFWSQKDYRVYVSDVVDHTFTENTSSIGDITLANADVIGAWGKVVLGGGGGRIQTYTS